MEYNCIDPNLYEQVFYKRVSDFPGYVTPDKYKTKGSNVDYFFDFNANGLAANLVAIEDSEWQNK